MKILETVLTRLIGGACVYFLTRFNIFMKLLVYFFEVWVGNVGIDLGGRNIAMAQHALDAS